MKTLTTILFVTVIGIYGFWLYLCYDAFIFYLSLRTTDALIQGFLVTSVMIGGMTIACGVIWAEIAKLAKAS